MIRDYTVTLAAGGEAVQNVRGSFVALKRCSVDLQAIGVQAYDPKGAAVISTALYQGEKIPASSDYTQLRLTNPGAQAVTVTIVAGFGSFQSDRLSGVISVEGVVRVEPVSSDPSLQMYQRQQKCDASAPGTDYPGLILSNPVGSGVTAYLRYYNLSADGGTMWAYFGPENHGQTPGIGWESNSIYDYSVVSSCRIESYKTASKLGSYFAGNQSIAGGGAGVVVDRDMPNAGVVLPEGYCFAVQSELAGDIVRATLGWEERANV
jgi:hypothetical protein